MGIKLMFAGNMGYGTVKSLLKKSCNMSYLLIELNIAGFSFELNNNSLPVCGELVADEVEYYILATRIRSSLISCISQIISVNTSQPV
jgi:hypothetical protein